MRQFYAGALCAVVPVALTGCGSGDSPSPAPPSPSPPADGGTTTVATTTTTTTPDDTACADNQGQCDQCLNGNCLSCKTGYVLDNSTVPGGTCVTSCTATADKPPKPDTPTGFNGQAWPEMCLSSKTSGHFYGIADWGGDEPGKTWPNPGVDSYHGGFMAGPDDHGQYYVARQMKDLASHPETEPDFVLNAGDNFYPGGYNDHCSASQATEDDPIGQFRSTVDEIYGGPGLDDKPWFGVLGNHDFGGISMGNGWDQTIFHSWHADNWRTPGTHWSQRVQYQDFAVQFFFLDSNYNDAGVDPNHDICQTFNGQVPFCSNWGINSANDCLNWFQEQWAGSRHMVEEGLKDSTAEWHILVTHYPIIFHDEDVKRWNEEYGIDMIFAGHDHTQVLTQTDEGIVAVTSGGGGGVTSDCGAIDKEHGNDDALGFVDFEINRTHLTVNMHTWGGCTSCDGTEAPGSAEQVIRATKTVYAHGIRDDRPPIPSPPAPAPSNGAMCCWGAYAGGCEEYQRPPTGQDGGGYCRKDWTTPCNSNHDCEDSTLFA